MLCCVWLFSGVFSCAAHFTKELGGSALIARAHAGKIQNRRKCSASFGVEEDAEASEQAVRQGDEFADRQPSGVSMA
jgi:hypothetical protein